MSSFNVLRKSKVGISAYTFGALLLAGCSEGQSHSDSAGHETSDKQIVVRSIPEVEEPQAAASKNLPEPTETLLNLAHALVVATCSEVEHSRGNPDLYASIKFGTLADNEKLYDQAVAGTTYASISLSSLVEYECPKIFGVPRG